MRLTLSIILIVICSFGFSQKKWSVAEDDSMQNARLLYDEGNYELALPILEELYKKHYNDVFLKYMYGGCALHRSDKHEIALTLLTQVYNKNKKAEDIELDLAIALHYNYKFDSATMFVDMYLARKKLMPEKKRLAEQTKKYINYAKYFYAIPTGAKITNTGPTVNTENDEYVPVITADESVMIFTYKGKESMGGRQNAYQLPDERGIFYEDVFATEKVNDTWVKPKGIVNLNTASHDAAIAISPDGTQLFTYRDNSDDHGDIYVSYLNGNDWSAPSKLKGQVNSFAWEGSCSLTSDGKTLYFSSERGGGYGGRDIYRATLLPDSTWGNVINLGDSINTSYDDDAPFIHPDGITLFFSSKGRNSMGDYDVFQTTMNPIDSTFKSPVINLGYPINTPDGDRYYVLSANGKIGYYSSEKSGGYGLDDIYTVDPGYVGKKPSIYLVKGKITVDSLPVDAKISVEIASKNKLFANYTSNKTNGKYLITLPPGAVYKITYSYKDFKPQTLDIDATAMAEYIEKDFNLEFNPKAKVDTTKIVITPTVAVVVKKDTAVVVKNKYPTDTYLAKTYTQKKTKAFAAKYPDNHAEGLVFKVQIAAYKHPRNYSYRHLKGLGKVEQLVLNDGITRMTIGGAYKTLGKAWAQNKKVIIAGQADAFVTALYKGKRVFLEELEAMGIFK